MTTLGKRLLEARTVRGWAQAELAERIKNVYPDARMTQQNIAQLESGKASATSYIVELADVLGVHAEWLQLNRGPRDKAKGILVEHPKVIALAKLATSMAQQPQGEYKLDQAVKIIATIAEQPDEPSGNKSSGKKKAGHG